MGGFGPVATGLIAIPLLKRPVGEDLTGFLLLTLGGFCMFFAEKTPIQKILPKIVIAAAGFGLMNVLQKIVFNQTNFVSGYMFFTLGTFFGSIAMLIPPSWRQQIFQHSEGARPKRKFWYMLNRFLAGVGSFLVVLAVNRANPSVVQAIAGVRYVTIFASAYLITKLKPDWFRENFRGRTLFIKMAGTFLVITGLVSVGLYGGSGD